MARSSVFWVPGAKTGSRELVLRVTPGTTSFIILVLSLCWGVMVATMASAAGSTYYAPREDNAQNRPHRSRLRELPNLRLSVAAVLPVQTQGAMSGTQPPVIVQFFNPTKSRGGVDYCLDGNVGDAVNGNVSTDKTGCKWNLWSQMFVWDWGDSTNTWGRIKMVSFNAVGTNLCLDNRGMRENNTGSAGLKVVPCSTANPLDVVWSAIEDVGEEQKAALKLPNSTALAGLLRSSTRSSLCMDDGGFLNSEPPPDWTLGRCDPNDTRQIISQKHLAWTVNRLWDAGDGRKHFMLRVRDAALCLDVFGGERGLAWFTDCDPSNPNQFFLFRVSFDNTLTAGNIVSYGARGCLTQTQDGILGLRECADYYVNQQFILEGSTGLLRNWFKIRENLCLDSQTPFPGQAPFSPCTNSSQQRLDMVLQVPPKLPKFFKDSPPVMVHFFNPAKSKGGIDYCMDGNVFTSEYGDSIQGNVQTDKDGCQGYSREQIFVWLWGDSTRTWGRIKVAGTKLCLDNRGMTEKTPGSAKLRMVSCDTVTPGNLLWYKIKDLKAKQKAALKLPASSGVGVTGLFRLYPNRGLCVDDGGFARNGTTDWTLGKCNSKNPDHIFKQQQIAWTANKLWKAGENTFMLRQRNDLTKCLDIGDGVGPEGARFTFCDPSRPNQLFRFQANSDSTLAAGRIQSYAALGCLQVGREPKVHLTYCLDYQGLPVQLTLEEGTGLLRSWSLLGDNLCLGSEGGDPDLAEFQPCSTDSSRQRIQMIMQTPPTAPSFSPDTPPVVVQLFNPTKAAGSTKFCLDSNAPDFGFIDFGNLITSECTNLTLTHKFVWFWGDSKKTWGRIQAMGTDLCVENRGMNESTAGNATLRLVPCGGAAPENILWSRVEDISAAEKKAIKLPASTGTAGLLRSYTRPSLCMDDGGFSADASSAEWTLKKCNSMNIDQIVKEEPLAWTVNKLWDAGEGSFMLKLRDDPTMCLDGRGGDSATWFTTCDPSRANQFFVFRTNADYVVPAGLIQNYANTQCLVDTDEAVVMQTCGPFAYQLFTLEESTGLLRCFTREFSRNDLCLDSGGGEPARSMLKPCDENSSRQRIVMVPASPPIAQNLSSADIILTWKRNLKGGDYTLGSWKGRNPCLQWVGILCDDTSSVVQIDVSNSLIQGTISADLGKITSLRYLDISKNQFQGGIPAELGQLINLKYLDLSNNQLTGTVPADIFSLNLTQGYLRNNQLTGNISAGPNGFPKATRQRAWDLSGNFFTDAPCDGVFKQLNCLSPRECKSDGIQRQASECSRFCGTTSPLGACGGHGYCFLSYPEKYPTCACDPGFKTSSTARGTCEVGNAPPPPPMAEARDNYTLGVDFLDYSPRLLNQHSRYLSAGSFLENGVPNWSLKMASAWMAPFWIFPSTVFSLGKPDNYSDQGVLSWGPVRDQGQCASCWAQASIDAIAAAVFSAQSNVGGEIPAFSAEQLRKCAPRKGNDSCSGGYPMNALEYAAEHVLAQEGDFSTCPDIGQGSMPSILMFESVQFRGWLGLLLTLQFQSALVILQGSSDVFQQPNCGIPETGFVLDAPSCYTGDLDHTVLVVGYDMTNPGSPYWVIRNSWGAAWCLGGYMRLGIQGGDGTCGMNVLPAYYPIPRPAPNDPCYVQSTISNGTPSRMGVLSPCGGGQCYPTEDDGYTCSCPEQYVAVNITVPGLKTSAQSCVPVDACKLSLLNPCGVGYCINDRKGGYVCVCPLGYVNGEFVTGKATCAFLGTSTKSDASLTVTAGVTCQVIAVTYNLTISALELQTKNLNCSNLMIGTKVNITNPTYQCGAGYVATSRDKTCANILFNTGMAYLLGEDGETKIQAATADLQRLNAALDCTSITLGQPVCLRSGKWKNIVCTNKKSIEGADCGKAAWTFFPHDPVDFFALNPGLDCGNLAKSPGLPRDVSTLGEKVCTGCDASGTTACKKGFSAYKLKRRDTCDKLVSRRYFKKYSEIREINVGFDCNNALVGQTICYRRLKTK